MEITTQLKVWRAIIGKSQEEMAALIGVHTNTYRSYETGKTKIDVETFRKIERIAEESQKRSGDAWENILSS